MYSQFLIKKTPLRLFRKLQKTERKKKQQSWPPAVPPGTWPCDRKKSYAKPPLQMPTALAKEQMPWAVN